MSRKIQRNIASETQLPWFSAVCHEQILKCVIVDRNWRRDLPPLKPPRVEIIRFKIGVLKLFASLNA